tara:strand:+ start:104 stop:523 length:420 start_codon:yes stop_codon:yes gene_type:complete
MLFYNWATEHFVRTYAAVVAALRGRKAIKRPSQRPGTLEEGIFLLNAEPGIEIAILFSSSCAPSSGIGWVRRHIGEKDLAHDQLVVVAADWVWAYKYRVQYAVRIFAWGLVCAGTIKTPYWRLVPYRNNFAFGPHLGRR